jgi:hypothetical protein
MKESGPREAGARKATTEPLDEVTDFSFDDKVWELRSEDGTFLSKYAVVDDGGYIVATGVTPREALDRAEAVMRSLPVCRECGVQDEAWNRRDYCLACGELFTP